MAEGNHKDRTTSLEEAVEPLKKIIPELDDYMKRVRKEYNKKSSDGLTPEESGAIYLYTMSLKDTSFSHLLNGNLRSKDQGHHTNCWLRYIYLLKSALEKLPIAKGMVYQITNGKMKEKYSKGKTVTWCGFTSCTRESELKAIVDSSSDKDLTLIRIKACTGRDISMYSCNSSEPEVVLLPGTRLCVKGVSTKPDLSCEMIDLGQIDDDAAESDVPQNGSNKNAQKDDYFGRYTTLYAF